MEELSIYNLTITSDHRLKVNNEEIGGDDSILPGDSESLLAWALVQVGLIQQDSDSNMALQIEDQRPNGYGTKKVTIPPRRSVLIEQLRERTGRDLSSITEEVQRRHAAEALPSAEATPEPEQAQEQWAGDGGANWDASDEAPGAETPSEAPAPQEPNTWEDETHPEAQTAEVTEADDEPALAPPPPLDESIPNAPAKPSATRKGRNRSYAETAPAPAPAQESVLAPAPESVLAPAPNETFLPEVPPHTEDHWERPFQPEQEALEQGNEQIDENWTHFDDPGRAEADNATSAPEVTEREDISSTPVTYKRNRPELGEGEAKKIEPKPKKERSKPMIAALIAVSLIAAFFIVQFVQSRSGNSYAATCIDERTMVRQASDNGCKNAEASYYRWWYTPNGSEVPAVNQTVSQAQGTRIRPEEATIKEGFAPEGGLYGPEAKEPAPEMTESPSSVPSTDAPVVEESGAAPSTGASEPAKSSAPPKTEKPAAPKSSDGK